jgi:AcrR family transcriptional regulator
VLLALESLLRDRDLERITMQDLARAAGVGVGTIYGRFVDRAALVGALYARYDDRLGGEIDRDLAPPRWDGLVLVQRIERLIEMAARHYREHAGVLRLIASPGSVRPRAGEMNHNSRRLLERIHEILLERRHEIRRSDPDTAARVGSTSPTPQFAIECSSPTLLSSPSSLGTNRSTSRRSPAL